MTCLRTLGCEEAELDLNPDFSDSQSWAVGSWLCRLLPMSPLPPPRLSHPGSVAVISQVLSLGPAAHMTCGVLQQSHEVPLELPFYRGGSRGPETLSALQRVTQLVSGI